MPNQTIHLEKYTAQSKVVVVEAQNLADELRHSQVTLLHLRVSFEAFLVMEELLAKTVNHKPIIARSDLSVKFKLLSEIDSRYSGSMAQQLSRLPKDAPGPNTAFLSESLVRLLKFSEEQTGGKHVTLKVLLHELICTMRQE